MGFQDEAEIPFLAFDRFLDGFCRLCFGSEFGHQLSAARGDTLLIQVEQKGPACHEGYNSCFFRSVEGKGEAFKITEPVLKSPEQMYKKKG